MAQVAVATQYKDQIIEYIRKGERLDDAIKGLGLTVTRQALSKVLKDDPEYNEAFIDYHAARLDKAEKMIEEAQDAVDVTRARYYHDAVKWRASKEARERWGDQPMIGQAGGVNIQINIGGVQPSGNTIDNDV